MTKSTITREQLEEWVAQLDEDGGCDATDRQLEALIRQSLATMDSEPVAEVIQKLNGYDRPLYVVAIECDVEEGDVLYRHAQLESEVVVTRNERGDIVAVTRQDAEGRVIDVIAEAAQPAPVVSEVSPLVSELTAPVVPDEVEHVAAVLELIGSFEAADIDSDTVDLRFEIDDVDTGSDASITEYAARGAAIIRMLAGNSPAIPDGYVMVPKVVTPAMAVAGGDVFVKSEQVSEYPTDAARNIYRAMLAAAPQSPGSEPATVPGKWIPVSVQMPETDGNYWGWWSESKRQGPVWFIKSELQAQFQSHEITHWMPLPAAPREVKDGKN